MTGAYRLSGQSGGFFSQIGRSIFLVVAAIGGLFMLVFSAAFAFFAVAGIAVIGAVIFAGLWLRAKILGRPFGPKAQFEAARRDMETQFEGMDLNMARNGPKSSGPELSGDGPIIDAHQTPEGWSVDD